MLPTDELICFCDRHRETLARITQEAIEKSRKDENQEPLAVAGLLALATLKDQTLYAFVSYLPPEHTRRRVQAAVAEYLEAL